MEPDDVEELQRQLTILEGRLLDVYRENAGLRDALGERQGGSGRSSADVSRTNPGAFGGLSAREIHDAKRLVSELNWLEFDASRHSRFTSGSTWTSLAFAKWLLCDGALTDRQNKLLALFSGSLPQDMASIFAQIPSSVDLFGWSINLIISECHVGEEFNAEGGEWGQPARARSMLSSFEEFGALLSKFEGDQSGRKVAKLRRFHGKAQEAILAHGGDDRNSSTPAQNGKDRWVNLELEIGKLERMVGLAGVKREVISLINLARIQKLRTETGMSPVRTTLHIIFLGSPGTGKTSVARLLGTMYHELGLLSCGHLVEADRSTLVSGYVGQTAINVRETLEKAKGGVLFIDEAYAFADKDGQGGFGLEAVNALVKGMEDMRDDFVVIAAGYTSEMTDFLNANAGLRSRFAKTLVFEDFTPEELHEVFRSFCASAGLHLDNNADARAGTVIRGIYDKRSRHFGNARDIRKFFEGCVEAQADRLAGTDRPTKIDLGTLLAQDIAAP
ncbi:MAG: AAA family ATPase [Fimbriimonadaceae bacterium]